MLLLSVLGMMVKIPCSTIEMLKRVISYEHVDLFSKNVKKNCLGQFLHLEQL